MLIAGAAAASALLAATAAAQPVNWAALRPASFVVTAGGSGNLRTAGAELGWRLPYQPLGDAVRLQLEAGVALWRPDAGSSLAVFNLSPNLRYEARPRLFVEGGIGVSLMTRRYSNGNCEFATNVNFVDHVGLSWSPEGGYPEVGLRVVHWSNAGIRQPNPGQNALQVRLSWPM